MRDQRSRHSCFTRAYAAQRLRQSLEVHCLRQVSGSASPERGKEVCILIRNGQHHELGLRQPPGYLPRRRKAAARHPDVQQAEVRPLAHGGLHGRGRISHISAHLEPAVSFQGSAHVVAGRRVVVGDQDAQRPGSGIHNTASTSLPRPGMEETRSSPPTEQARSRMEISPKPPPRTLVSNPHPASLTRSRTR